MSLTYLENRHNKFDSGWTDERVAMLRLLWAEGYSASQIADKFKGAAFTRSSVIGKAHRLKLAPRKARQSVKPQVRRANGGVPKPPMPPPRPMPPSPLPPQPTAPRMRQLTFFRLKPQHCRWPLGLWDEPARLFCAADTDGETYCPFHERLARARKERDDYNATDDFARSIDECYREIRARKAQGGKGWGGWE
jgi:GcrA cell cycle regulator